MDPNLEAIVAADEECRARVEAAAADGRSRVDAARQASAERRQARLEALHAALEAEERAIRSDADRARAERQTLRATYLETKQQAAEGVLAEAAELFARIVRDGRVPRRQ